MTLDTNHRPDNEEWLFNAIAELEELSLLPGFCRHAGIQAPPVRRLLAETVWPLVRRRYQTGGGHFDVSAACRDMLSFPPFIAAAAGKIRPAEK